MTGQKDTRLQTLQEALATIKSMNIAEGMQGAALEYLLRSTNSEMKTGASGAPAAATNSSHADLRAFIASLNPSGAVSQIPCLLYWARENEGANEIDGAGVVQLFRRAGLRPPGNVEQSLRDLSSKKYGRVEFVEGRAGYVRLSVVGETFVLHDVAKK